MSVVRLVAVDVVQETVFLRAVRILRRWARRQQVTIHRVQAWSDGIDAGGEVLVSGPANACQRADYMWSELWEGRLSLPAQAYREHVADTHPGQEDCPSDCFWCY